MLQVIAKIAILVMEILLLVKVKTLRENMVERSILLYLIAANVVSFLPIGAGWLEFVLSIVLYFVLDFVVKNKMKK